MQFLGEPAVQPYVTSSSLGGHLVFGLLAGLTFAGIAQLAARRTSLPRAHLASRTHLLLFPFVSGGAIGALRLRVPEPDRPERTARIQACTTNWRNAGTAPLVVVPREEPARMSIAASAGTTLQPAGALVAPLLPALRHEVNIATEG
ncbi:hypothetical protein [Streptomyces sp. NPDC050164]|uniref:hypothetical protein n=1 Tax=Streptomyces sp. NPDC050164 TaxID=3365605 RepID=UPI003795FF35